MASSTAAWTSSALPPRPGAAGRPVRAEDVPVGGDGGEPGRDHPPRRRPVGDEHHALQQRPHRRRDRPVPGHRRRRPPRPRHAGVPDRRRRRPRWSRAGPRAATRRPGSRGLRQLRQRWRAPARRRVRPQVGGGPRQRRSGRRPRPGRRGRGAGRRRDRRREARPRVARPEGAEGRDGGVEVGHGDAVGQLAQRRGDRGAGPASTATSADTVPSTPVGPGERRRAVAAGQPDRQRLHPRPPVRPLLLGLPLPRDELGHPAARGLVGAAARARAALLQRGVALGEGAELLAGARQLGLGGRGALLRLGERVGQPLDLLRRGRGPAAQRLGPARERREPVAAVGERADGGQVRPLGRGQRALVLGARLGDLRRARAAASTTAATSASSCSAIASASASSSSGSRPGARASAAPARWRARSAASADGAARAARPARTAGTRSPARAASRGASLGERPPPARPRAPRRRRELAPRPRRGGPAAAASSATSCVQRRRAA